MRSYHSCLGSNFGGWSPCSANSNASYFPSNIARAPSVAFLLVRNLGYGPEFWKVAQVNSFECVGWKQSPNPSTSNDAIIFLFKFDCFYILLLLLLLLLMMMMMSLYCSSVLLLPFLATFSTHPCLCLVSITLAATSFPYLLGDNYQGVSGTI